MRVAIIGLASVALALPSSAQPGVPAQPPTLIMSLAVESAAKGSISVINGKPVRPSDWPALVLIRKPEKPHCTAALIGPRTILTAAHCIDVPSKAPAHRLVFRINGFKIPVRCTMSPKYLEGIWTPNSIRNSADYALCIATSDITAQRPDLLADGIDTELIPTRPEPVLLMGYGCIANGGTPTETLRAGDAHVSGGPSPGLRLQNRIQTSAVSTDTAAICRGDSGGPLWRGATLADQADGKRRIVAVNSSTYPTLISIFAALATADFRAFLKTWSDANPQAIICGTPSGEGHVSCRG